MSRIFVTGIGIISSIGNNAAENHRSLSHEKGGLGEADLLSSKFTSLLPFGEVKKSNATLRQELGVFEKGVTRTSLLALHAFDEAVQDAGISPDSVYKVRQRLRKRLQLNDEVTVETYLTKI